MTTVPNPNSPVQTPPAPRPFAAGDVVRRRDPSRALWDVPGAIVFLCARRQPCLHGWTCDGGHDHTHARVQWRLLGGRTSQSTTSLSALRHDGGAG